jgi:hypothetical protein
LLVLEAPHRQAELCAWNVRSIDYAVGNSGRASIRLNIVRLDESMNIAEEQLLAGSTEVSICMPQDFTTAANSTTIVAVVD